MKKGRPSNPFSVSRLGPRGASYLFVEGDSVDRYISLLDRVGIVELSGCEGSGKSTLLYTIETELRERGCATNLFRCRDDVQQLPFFWRLQLRRAEYCFLDGGERLNHGQLEKLVRFCRRRNIRLLATTHEPLEVGDVLPMAAGLDQLSRLITQVAGTAADQEHVQALLERRGGNAREVLFDLYDEYEQAGQTSPKTG